MLLCDVDAFDYNDKHFEAFSDIATSSGTAGEAAIFTAFARSQDSGSGRGSLPIADAGFGIE
jgi:hypothetical protein